MAKVFIIEAKRTPVGAFGGALKDISAVDLAVTVAKNVIEKTKINSADIDEVIIGNVLSAGLGQNISRQIALKAGIPESVPAFSLNKVCGSGMKAVQLAYQSILSGDADLVLAGGTENMSQAPYLNKNIRFGLKMGDTTFEDSMIKDGLWCSINDYHMGITAENIAEKYSITREEQDEFAFQSQQKAAKALADNVFEQEIVPVEIKTRKQTIIFDKDEYPKPETSVEKLSTLRAAFKKDGSVTAGNASGINDGASILLIASEDYVKKHNIKPKAEITAMVSAGVSPEIMGIGPVAAINKLVSKKGISLDEIDLFELNEAFAVQALAVLKDLNIAPEKVNINGGAIALGHPIGASGARIITTLLHSLEKQQKQKGIASLCIGGGMGIAMSLEICKD